MQAKLTLKLDETTVGRAKKYALSTNQSLSAMVEGYFKSLSQNVTTPPRKPTPIVNRLSGSVKVSRNRNLSNEYTEYLERKYTP